jgi:polyvinyl alcohol dehydrogenase (cytochrome)
MDCPTRFVAWFLLLTAACLVGCGNDESPAEPESITTTELSAEASTGEELFGTHCATCHGDPDNKQAIPLPIMTRLNPAHLMFTLTNGVMKGQVEGLRTDQLLEIIQFVAGGREPFEPSSASFCPDTAIDSRPLAVEWGQDRQNSGTVAEGVSTIRSETVDELRLAWAFGLPDVADARSQPVVTEDTIFIAATSGHLFALDTSSGCTKWHRSTEAPPRTALTLGSAGGEPVLFYGDIEAFVNAIDPYSGDTIWRTDVSIAEHTLLTGSPQIHDGHLIVPLSLYEVGLTGNPEYECCKSHGGVASLNPETGEVLWTTPMTEQATPQGFTKVGVQSWGPSGVPVWSTPTIDTKRGLVYIGTGQNASQPATEYSDAVLALSLSTGEVVWHFQTIAGDAYNMACDQRPPGPNCPKWRGPDHDIGAAVVLTRDTEGRDRLIVGQKSGDIYSLDPDSAGKVVWRTRVGAGSALGGVHWGLAVNDGVIYAPVADPPYPIPGYRPAPGLYALDVEDGDLLWESPVERGCETNLFEYFGRTDVYPECSFFYGLSAAPTLVNDLLFSGALDGRLRAFRTSDGVPIWRIDTARVFETVNGVPGHGGSIDVAAVQVAGDLLYVQSGYSQFGQLPGNLLLAFELAPGNGVDSD